MRPGGRQRRWARRSYITAGFAVLAALVLAGVAFAASSFSEVSGSPFAVGMGPAAVAYSAGGKLLAVANATDHTVSIFSVGSGGGLTPVTNSPFPDDYGPQSIAFSPDGKLVATGDFVGNTIKVFAVGANGELTDTALPAQDEPAAVAFSPDGTLLASVSYDDNDVYVYVVNSDGSLTEVPGSPFPTGTHPAGVAFNPSGKLLATADQGSNAVSVFSLASSGTLTQVPNSPFPTGSEPSGVAFSPDGGLLVTANSVANNLSVFSVAATGNLSQVTGSPVPVGSSPQSVAFAPFGGLLAAANDSSSSSVSLFSFTSAGALTPVPGSPLPTGSGAEDVAFSPAGGLLAVPASNDNTVHVISYPIGSPTVTISSPANGATFTVGQAATASFSCAEGTFGPGLSSCNDSVGTTTASGGSAKLDTSKVGTFTYAVTATSRSGQTAHQSVSYQVQPASSTSTSGTSTSTSTSTSSGLTTTVTSLKTAGPVATLKLSCTGMAGRTCTEAMLLSAHVRKQGTKLLAVTAEDHPGVKKITSVKTKLGAAKFSVKAGTTKTVRISLNPAGRRLLAELYGLKATAALSGTTAKSLAVRFAYGRVTSPINYTWHSNAAFSYESELNVSGLPHGAVIVVTCHGGGCPAAGRPIRTKTSHYSLTKTLATAHLRPGTRLTLTITAPNAIAKVVTFVVRGSSQTPGVQEGCLPPGYHKAVKCRG